MRITAIAGLALLSALAGCDGGSTAPGEPADGGVLDRGADAARPDAVVTPGADGAPRDAAPSPDEGEPADAADVGVAPDAAPAPPPMAPLITEFMARNDGALLDEDGRASDWIELYNPHRRPIALGGFGLSDEADGADPWLLPDLTLDPGGYRVVFASGEDRRDPERPLHADFRLDGDGEPLTLVDPAGAVIQRFSAVPHAVDVAHGLPATALVAPGAEVRHRSPGPDDGWQAPEYDDGAWTAGPTGIGRDPGGPPSALDPWADALLSHWSFDEVRAGPDGVSVVPDTRPGSPRDLRLEQSAALVDGRAGQALTGGFARVLAADGFDFTRDFTWALWMSGVDPSGALISRNAPGIAWSRGAKALFVRRGVLRFDAGWVGAPRTRTFVNDGRWHHVAVTWRADTDRMVIYVDGVPRFDEPFDADAFPEDLDDPPVRRGLFVGGTDFAGGLPDLGPYDGRIDDVTIWGAALPPEALDLLAEGAAPPAVGPFAGLIATPTPDAAGGQLRARFTAGPGLAAAVLRLRFDDGVIAWIDGEPVAAALESPRDDRLAAIPADVAAPLPAPGAHLLAVEAVADAADLERWVVLPELWGLEAAPTTLVRPTPGALNAPGRSPAVVIDPPDGVVVEPIAVTVSAPAASGPAAIHYTLDGRAPTAADPVYAGPLRIAEPGVLRAVAIAEGRAPGPVASARFMGLDPALGGFTSPVPVVVIDRGGAGPPRQGTYGDALLAAWVPGPDGLTRLADAPALVSRAAIRIRGQSSAGFAKAPYRVELRDAEGRDRSEPLLGLPPDADWVLHGPFVDKSLVRNALVYGIGRDMGLEAPRSAPFELYLRGDDGRIEPADARGVYLLVERIEAGGERLDINRIDPADDGEPAITGGWILKFEAGAAEAPIVPGWESLEVVEPGDPTAAQMAWVRGALAAFDDALDEPGFQAPDAPWRAMLDLDSAVDQIIVNELFRDQDGYVRSQYLHRDRGGPWVIGPLWDYNLVAGTGGFFDNLSTTGWQYRQQYNRGEHGWFARMMDDPTFAAAVAARWRALRVDLLSDDAIAARVAGLTADLIEPAARNFAIWPNLGAGRISAFTSPSTATWDAQVEVLLDWLARRAAWLDGQWGG